MIGTDRDAYWVAIVAAVLVLAAGLLVGCGGSSQGVTAKADLAPDFSGVGLDGSPISASLRATL